MVAATGGYHMTLPTPFRSVLKSRPIAAPAPQASAPARRRAAALVAQLQDFRPAELAAAWRARAPGAAFWRPVGASILLHIGALAGLVLLHHATFRTAEPAKIEVALAPSDPDARVGPLAGIAWASEAERTAVMALLDARRSASLTSEIVITPGRSPRAPSRPSVASRAAPADPAPPARAAPPEPRPADARPAEPHPADPPPPAAVAQAVPPPAPEPVPQQIAERVAEPVPERLPDPNPAEPVAAPATLREPEPVPRPAVQAAAAPVDPPSRLADPPAAPPATAEAATPTSPALADRGDKSYLQAVFERLRPIRDYPELARYHTSGRMQVAITVGRDGTVLDTQVRHSSGYGFLDRAGLDLIHRASPLPALPFSIASESYTFEVPISFRYD
jgi:protein TonB